MKNSDCYRPNATFTSMAVSAIVKNEDKASVGDESVIYTKAKPFKKRSATLY